MPTQAFDNSCVTWLLAKKAPKFTKDRIKRRKVINGLVMVNTTAIEASKNVMENIFCPSTQYFTTNDLFISSRDIAHRKL